MLNKSDPRSEITEKAVPSPVLEHPYIAATVIESFREINGRNSKETKLIVAKNRNGPTDEILLGFAPKTTTFTQT